MILKKFFGKGEPHVEKEESSAVQKFNIVIIGNQNWTTENLGTSRYRNGDPIPQIKDKKEWVKLTTGAWCYYNNDVKYGKDYGKLYNWYAINDSRGIAPLGWHVPSDEEWYVLLSFLHGNAGGKLKEPGTLHWASPNAGADNSSGFTALGGGNRHLDGTFEGIRSFGHWWSSTGKSPDLAYYWYLDTNYADFYRGGGYKILGFSVRCLKD